MAKEIIPVVKGEELGELKINYNYYSLHLWKSNINYNTEMFAMETMMTKPH